MEPLAGGLVRPRGLSALPPAGLYGLPRRSGKLKDLSKFDAAFFGVHPKQAHTMDPQLRLLLEVTYEAIVDGGERPRRALERFHNRLPAASLACPGAPVSSLSRVCLGLGQGRG